ncbi:hypothetical protein [Georgenia ruanii]|uniref:hypothetical protein n=1 Tax=Georgenia ruanii TaxID=348442 RepID=UPI001264F4E2|nr:hypothetical protein [Georgenia ruanii]
MTAVGVLFLLAGAAMFARLELVLARANPRAVLPTWRRPAVLPRAAGAWRFGGVFCVIYGANLVVAGRTAWWVGVLLILAASGPALVIHARHDRRVRLAAP